MTSEEIKEFAARVVNYYQTITDEDTWRLVVYTLAELAKGEPVEPARLAELMHEPVEKTIERLKDVVEWDDQGRVIGQGLTLVPTQHEYALNGRKMWVWCSGDSVAFSSMIGVTAQIRSPCAVTGEMIEATISPDAVHDVTPASAVMDIIIRPGVSRLEDVRRLICSGQVFFKSADVAKEWQRSHPDANILSIADGFAVYREVTRQMWTYD